MVRVFVYLLILFAAWACGSQEIMEKRSKSKVDVNDKDEYDWDRPANWDGEDKSLINLESNKSEFVQRIFFQSRNKINLTLDANKLVSGVQYQIYDQNSGKNIVSVMVNELLLIDKPKEEKSFMPFSIDLSSKLVYGENILGVRSEEFGESSFETIKLTLKDFTGFDLHSATAFSGNKQKSINFEGWTSIYSAQLLEVEDEPTLTLNFQNMIQ